MTSLQRRSASSDESPSEYAEGRSAETYLGQRSPRGDFDFGYVFARVQKAPVGRLQVD